MKNKPTAIAGLIILLIVAILLIAVSANFLLGRDKTVNKWFEAKSADIIKQPSQTETEVMHSVCRVDSAKVVNGIVNSASGSGFCAFEPGLLVTAYHVVNGFNEYAAYFDNGDYCLLDLLAYDAANDVALLAFRESENHPVLNTGSVRILNAGDALISISSPGEEYNQLTHGSFIGNSLEVGLEGRLLYGAKLKTDKGSSGSPVFNENFEVVGILVGHTYDDEELDADFFTPIDSAKNVYKSWKASGHDIS